MLNRCEFIGNLTKDPELKQTPKGTQVTNFDIAVDKKWTDWNWQQQEKVEFVSIVAFKKLAEIVTNYAKKGDKIYVAGEMQTRTWETEDGSKRYKTEILLEKVVLLWAPGEKQTPNQSQKPAQNTTQGNWASPPKPKYNPDDEISIEDIPF